jgi:hypothetical protein
VAYNEHLEVTDSAIEAFFAKHLKPEVNVKAAGTSSGAEETAAMDALLQSFVDQKKVLAPNGAITSVPTCWAT